jgi:ion channel-forming bestrophin family protein
LGGAANLGAIVNDSRAWGLMVSNFVAPGSGAQRRLIYRQLAWLTALRYHLREPRNWENMTRRHNVEYRKFYRIVEWEGDLRAELEALLDPAEIEFLLKKKNTATQLIAIQSKEIRELTVEGSLGEVPRLEM